MGAVDLALAPAAGTLAGYNGVIGALQTAGGPDLTAAAKTAMVDLIRVNDMVGTRPEDHDLGLTLAGIWDCAPGGSKRSMPHWTAAPGSTACPMQWAVSDAVEAQITSGGFRHMLRVGDEWEESFAANGVDLANATATEWYIQAAILVAQRYYSRAHDVDLNTEVTTNFLHDGVTKEEYLKWWPTLYGRVQAALPAGTRIIGPGIVSDPPSTYNDKHQAYTLVRALWDYHLAHPLTPAPTAIDWHFFEDDPLLLGDFARGWNDLLNGTGPWKSVPWANSDYFDSVGQVVGAQMPATKNAPYAGTVLGATRTTAVKIVAASTGLIDEMAIYRLQGFSASVPMGTLFAGGAEGTPYPMAHAWMMWGTLQERYPTLTGTLLPAATAGLYCVTATGIDGWAMLCANMGAAAVPIGHSFAVEEYTSTAKATVSTLTDTGVDAVSYTPGSPISVPPAGVVMVEVAR